MLVALLTVRKDLELFPVTKVVLSKNGVAYFERRGQVQGNSNVELFFRTSDMNGLLVVSPSPEQLGFDRRAEIADNGRHV